MLAYATAAGVAGAVLTPSLRGGQAVAAGARTYALAEKSAASTAAAFSPRWGGHENGQIPTSAMTQVSVAKGSPYLRPDAAESYGQLSEAFRRQFGQSLPITEAYRTYALQYQYFTERYTRVAGPTNIQFEGSYWALRDGQSPAAVPGTSNHGWGVAADFGGGVASYGTAQKNWMNANAPSYGWEPTGDSFSPREAWHFDYTSPWSGDSNPTPTYLPQEEDEDMYARRSNGEVAIFGASYRSVKGGGTGRHVFASPDEYNAWRSLVISHNTTVDASSKRPVPPELNKVMNVDDLGWGVLNAIYGT